jgi:predicted Fe-Mo cluster-binding NifX family protein
MLIAITSEGESPDSLVAEKLGRTPFLAFYDTANNAFEFLRNPYINTCGGAGIQIAQLIIENNATAVITSYIGKHSFRILKAADIEIYSCSRKKISEIIDDYEENKLIPAEQVYTYLVERKCRRKDRRRWNKG